MNKIYANHKCTKLECNSKTAEFIKYASNSFLAAKISFANEMANLSNEWGIDFEQVAEGMGLDNRISPLFLRAGAGFGGSCFPKDVKALAAAAKYSKVESKMLGATLEVNEEQPKIIIKMTEERLGKLKNKKIAVLGLAFKPDTDDVRETRSEVVISDLLEKKANVIAHDPIAMNNFKELIDVPLASDIDEATRDADCVIFMTEWNQYKEINLEQLRKNMKGNVIIDGRRIFNKVSVEEAGFDYKTIGLG